MTTERELLSISTTPNKFCTILFGHHITVYTDHNNLTIENFTTKRVLRWRLMLEKYVPEIKYIKCLDNYASKSLIRLLPLINSDVTESDITR